MEVQIPRWAAFSPDGRLLAFASWGADHGGVSVWDSHTWTKIWEGPSGPLRSVAFSADGSYVVGGGAIRSFGRFGV